jgi:alginate O-acetyltransferase complex protein AlgI
MLASIIFNFQIGRLIARRKSMLVLGILANILLIVYFKYSYFIIENLNNISLVNLHFEKLVLPLGISFFTFQQIAYLVDIYNGGKPEQKIVPYALFVSFFPHSIAGPLVQYQDIAPQLEKVSLSTQSFVVGFNFFIIGLFKKVVIADGLAPCANLLFDAGAGGRILTFGEAWVGAVSYSLQLYFDFSGYSDMAIGLAKIFNIRFPINFDSPYKATSIIDFWRRWHITLSVFLRDYLYIPLGGNRKGVYLKHANLLLTMLIGGLWHGANWTFVLWGGLHGLFLIINHLWVDLTKRLGLQFINNRLYTICSWLLTMLCVVLAWVLFRAKDFSSAIAFYKSMFGFNGIALSPRLANIIPSFSFIKFDGFFNGGVFPPLDYLPLLCAAIIITVLFTNTKTFFKNNFDVEQLNMKDNHILSFAWSPSKRYAIISAIMTAWIFMVLLSARKLEFLYFGF